MHKYNSNDGIEYESEDESEDDVEDDVEDDMYWCDSETSEYWYDSKYWYDSDVIVGIICDSEYYMY